MVEIFSCWNGRPATVARGLVLVMNLLSFDLCLIPHPLLCCITPCSQRNLWQLLWQFFKRTLNLSNDATWNVSCTFLKQWVTTKLYLDICNFSTASGRVVPNTFDFPCPILLSTATHPHRTRPRTWSDTNGAFHNLLHSSLSNGLCYQSRLSVGGGRGELSEGCVCSHPCLSNPS